MLEVRDQVSLPFRRMLDLCLDTISYRLFRSMVTVVIIILAIAFLASIMVEGYLGRSVRDTVLSKTRQRTAYSRFLSKTSHVDPDEKLLLNIAGLKPGATDFDNFLQWAGFSGPEQAKDFLARTRHAAAYLDFFETMSVGRRAVRVEGRSGLAIFDWLEDKPANFELFSKRLEPMRSLKLPGSFQDFQQFIGQWKDYRKKLAVCRDNYTATVQRIAAECGPGGVSSALSAAIAANRTDAFFAQIKAAGFRADPAEVPDIIKGMAYQKDVAWAMDQLRKPPLRGAWNRDLHESFSPTQALYSAAGSSSRVEWIKNTLADSDRLERDKWQRKVDSITQKTPEGQTPKLPPEPKSYSEGFDSARFLAVAREYASQTDLLAAEQELVNRYGRSAGLSEKAIWLIVVSFVVCVVGIANAMLMSVLERFKEIATMKCLGARNSTIGFMFITESTIMGIIGGVIGVVLGFVIVLVRQTMVYGSLLYEKFPYMNMWTAFLVCLSCSLLLSAVAAIYPARVAARMAPMEAMRVD